MSACYLIFCKICKLLKRICEDIVVESGKEGIKKMNFRLKKKSPKHGRYYKKRYKLMQFLMFADDTGEPGYNQFTVLPKLMMLQDMKNDYNQLKIDELDIEYEIIENDISSQRMIFNGKRKWHMKNVESLNGKKLESFVFYTNTDLGERTNPHLKLKNNVEDVELDLESDLCFEDGTTQWNWDFRKHLSGSNKVQDVILDENVLKAWDFNQDKEIIYFFPRGFAQSINSVCFTIWADATVPKLKLYLFKIVDEKGKIERKEIQRKESCVEENGRKCYKCCPAEKIDMDAVYYILLLTD